MLRNFKNSISLQEHRLFISPNNTIVIWRLNKNKKKMLKDLFIKKLSTLQQVTENQVYKTIILHWGRTKTWPTIKTRHTYIIF